MLYRLKNKLKEFYRIWIKDCISLPFDYIKKNNNIKKIQSRTRDPLQSNVIYVNIHEWGGYPLTRRKNVKGMIPFECGLYFQLKRFKGESSKNHIELSITISEIEKYSNLIELRNYTDKIYSVNNIGMDFSGHAYFYSTIENKPNAFVILTNSSINKNQSEFLESYLSYMKDNPDVGILGISSCSMYYHTLLRHNFNPHLQSFFLLTTISVLNEIVSYNNKKFPGIGETNKHLLIRNGEVKLSKIALLLGYNLAVVTESGVTKFNYSNYPFVKGDLRKFSKNPNSIIPINY